MSDGDAWTTRKLLAWMAESFAARGLESPKLCAEILLTHVLGCPRLSLYTDADRPASAEELSALRGLVRRAHAHEPVQYLVGRWSFFGLGLKVDRRALIPRPCTETIAEHALQTLRAEGRSGGPLLLADVCTGSGCLGLALVKHLPAARAVLTDVSGEALTLAGENAAELGLSERVELVEGDLLRPLADRGPFDVLVANPPYIPDGEWAGVPANVREHEPELALRGGADGLALVRPLLEGAAAVLAPGGLVAVEVAASTAGAAEGIARGAGLEGVRVLKDHEGLARVVVGRSGAGVGSA